jgi:nicotinamide phosphoribosyltransferase
MYKLVDQVNSNEENKGELKVIYKDGNFLNVKNLQEIREIINANI